MGSDFIDYQHNIQTFSNRNATTHTDFCYRNVLQLLVVFKDTNIRLNNNHNAFSVYGTVQNNNAAESRLCVYWLFLLCGNYPKCSYDRYSILNNFASVCIVL